MVCDPYLIKAVKKYINCIIFFALQFSVNEEENQWLFGQKSER